MMDLEHPVADKVFRKRALDELPADLELATRPQDKPVDLARYRTCDVCGQDYDIKNLQHVDHHSPAPHAPLRG
jgi:hypothetical protein